MINDTPDPDEVANLLLPLDGPYHPDRVIEAARTVAELVRRLNHATFHASAMRYPPQLNRTVGALRFAVYGLDQTFNQIARRLDGFANDPCIEHDDRGDPWAGSADAAQHLRQAAEDLRAVTVPLDRASAITSHLGYDTTAARSQPRGHPFRPPAETDPPATPSPTAGQSQPSGRANRARPR